MGACCFDYDPPEFFRESYVKARKEYKCCECRGVIKPGETYQYIVGKWEGYLDRFKTCEKCADLRESLMDVWCPAYTDLKDSYREYLDSAGFVRYDEDKDEYIYPENHMNLNR